MGERTSGSMGFLGLAGAVVLYLFLRRHLPSLASALLGIAGIGAALIAALVAAVVYFAFRKPENGREQPETAEASAVLARGRSGILELRRMGMRVKNEQIRRQSEEICARAEKILRVLKEQPEDLPRVRQFFNYYLPTLGGILLKYLRLEEGGVPDAGLTERTVACLGDIRTAMEKQYTSLFDNDLLDLSVEMEALTLALRRDGLLEEESVHLRDGDRHITLTL